MGFSAENLHKYKQNAKYTCKTFINQKYTENKHVWLILESESINFISEEMTYD